jgi:dihydroxyacetone kinase
MATATIKEMKIDKVNLELNSDELDMLCIVLNCIGGTPSTSMRKHADSIANALTAAGVDVCDNKYVWSNKIDRESSVAGSIYFKDEI